MTRVRLSRLRPADRQDRFGSVWVSHGVEMKTPYFIGCCWNISLPWWSPVNNNPAVATTQPNTPRMVAGHLHGLGI